MSANDKASATYGPGRTTPPLEARVAAVLAEHKLNVTNEWCMAEGCGWNAPWGTVGLADALLEHRAHQAAMLAPVIWEAQAEAWDKGADLANRIYPLDYDGANPYRSAR